LPSRSASTSADRDRADVEANGALRDQFVDATAISPRELQRHPRTLLMASRTSSAGSYPTGNKSELSVGYSTLYGDLAGGFALIKTSTRRSLSACRAG